MQLPLSILDLASVPSGHGASEALRRIHDLALLAERCGYTRYWFAEHHSLPSIASAAPEVLIGYAAGLTRRIRVGAGGILLPNHAPLRIAEAFRSLAALYGARIDLGLGRAPNAEDGTNLALRSQSGERFAHLLAELMAICGEADLVLPEALRNVTAMPEDVPLPPVWILGSSGASASLAGQLGFGYGFAGHFTGTPPAGPAFGAYRQNFAASRDFPHPQSLLVIAAVCAESDRQANHHARSYEHALLRIRQGHYDKLQAPDELEAYRYSDDQRSILGAMRQRFVVGDPAFVRERIGTIVRESGASEVMIVSDIHDHDARLRSFELIAAAFGLAA
jgi:luciferase family oxidoreductase group 1